MNNDQVKQLIQGLGVMTELWMITYHGFKKQGLIDSDAIDHTKALMSLMVNSFMGPNNLEEKQ